MNVESLFHRALEVPAGERTTFLERACGDDTDLRRRVELLLHVHDNPGSFLAGPALTPPSQRDTPHGPTPLKDCTAVSIGVDLSPPIIEKPGTSIGPYHLLQTIGEGGMGVVFLAEQTRPVQRQVALKIIKPGMDSRQVVARFEAERQALAMMDHPNIAKVLDGGETPTGRPYFVMELVKGVPLNKYCDDHQLPVRQRLELFVSVCQAVQHAHQKGLIHRDLKPSNVIVTEYDSQPAPKVIDFGIAKAVDRRSTMHTNAGILIGTPEYMSPEQADANASDIDTRSDIYAMGVMLYELLVGETPFARRAEKANIWEVLRVIREEEPAAPSACLSTVQTLTEVATRRATEPGRLVKQVRGELDWIVLKALDKDRSRRYPTASALAEDVGRYLRDEPVEAGPPTRAYRLHKFIRRNRGKVIAAGIGLGLLVAGTAGTTYGMIRALQAEAVAVDERDGFREVSNFLANDLLAQASVYNQDWGGQPRDPDVKLRTLLDRAAEKIEGKFERQPRVEAKLRHVIGQVYNYLGDPAKGQYHLERSRAIFPQAYPQESTEEFSILSDVSFAYYLQADYDRAEPALQELIAALERAKGPNHEDTLRARTNLAEMYRKQGNNELAQQLLDKLLEECRLVLGSDHATTLQVIHNLAAVVSDLGYQDRADVLLQEAVAGRRRVLGPDHPSTLISISQLASLYGTRQDFARAAPLLAETLESQGRLLGSDHRDTLATLNNLGNVYLNMKEHHNKAEILLTELWQRRRDSLGPEHEDTLKPRMNLASLYTFQQRFDEAEKCWIELVDVSRRKLGADHWQTLVTINNLASVYLRQKKLDQAEPLFREVVEKLRKDRAPRWDLLRGSHWNLVEILVRKERWSEAEAFARQLLAECEKREPQSFATNVIRSLLGEALVHLKSYEEAEVLLLASYHSVETLSKGIPPETYRQRRTEIVGRIVRLYEAWSRTDQAALWRAKLDASANPVGKSP